MNNSLAHKTIDVRERIFAVILVVLLIVLASGSSVSAQTQFGELTKVSYAPGNSTDYFGRVLAIDGNTMIIGANEFDLTAPNARNGAAFIYVRQPNGAWTLQQSLFPGVTSNDFRFGSCVGISGDTAIIGSPGEEAAYIFTRTGTVWAQFQRIVKGGAATGFGQNCAMSGNSVIISSRNEAPGMSGSLGVAYIFALSGGTWAQQARLTAIAGSVAPTLGDFVTIDGDTAAIGAQSDDSFRGSLQVYVRSGTTWSPQQRIVASDGLSGNLFGASASISGDTVIVGATDVPESGAQDAGSAYVFTRSGGVWTQQQKLASGDSRPQARFGTSVTVEGNTAVVGSIRNNPINGFEGGAGYVFQRSGNTWTRTQRLLPADNHGDRFGLIVDLSGSNVVVGATQDVIGQNSEQGSAYVFSVNPSTCTYSLSPTRSSLFPSGGGTGSFAVTTQAGCVWQATMQDRVQWTTTSSAGTGSGTVDFAVAANTGKPRRTEISINGQQVYYVNQSAGLAAEQGDFDQTFANTGFTTNKLFDSNVIRSVKVQPDGKVVVAGTSFGGAGEAAIVLRYNGDGSLDTTFDGDGIAATTIEISGSAFTDVVIQPDGKIVAAGSGIPVNANQYFAVVRYNSNGSLDTTFGTGGIVRTEFDSTSESASAVGLTSDGKIVVAGTTFNNSFAFARYNSNGSLDTTFDGDGKVLLPGFSVGTPSDMALQPDGKIVGVTEGNGTTFVRLNTNGSLDTTFDTDGKVEIPGNMFNSARTIAVQPDGKILGAGMVSSTIAVVRLNASGSLDTTFAGDGIANDTRIAIPAELALQSNGKIILSGSTAVSTPFQNDVIVHRFNSNGSLDTTFGGDGRITSRDDATFQDSHDASTAVAIAPDGKIVVAGEYRFRVGQRDVMVMRFLGEGVGARRAPYDYDGDGKTDLSVFRPSSGAWFLNQSTAGFFGMLFGFSTDKIAPADYDGDGKTDIAIFRPSDLRWYIANSSDGTYRTEVFGLASDLPAPADYDGDGKADLCVFRPSDGTWYIQYSSNGTFFARQFGANGDKPTVGDFDGDGKADLAVFRTSNGEWYQVWSSDNSIHGEQFGFTTDRLAYADYDGDGKTDLAIFRPSERVFYIKNSGNSTYSAFVFGLSDDIPTPGDYDGDGKADLSVFRPSDGNWYRQNSSNGSFNAFNFGLAGDKPTPTAFH